MADDEASKTRRGGVDDTATNYEKLGAMHKTAHQNDGFNVLGLYCSKLNPACNAFVQFSKRFWKGPEESVSSENRCLGLSKLGSMMKEVSKAANLSKVYTNHCVMSTAITLWSNAGLSNCHIMMLSGRRNENSLTSYNAPPSSQQLQVCSNVLSCALNPQAAQAHQQMQVFPGNQQQLQQSRSAACAMIPNQQNFMRHDE